MDKEGNTDIIRNDKNIRSWKDAMSFRKNGEKLHVKHINATIYHYGWVKEPVLQQQKRIEFHKLWHPDEWIQKNHSQEPVYEYNDVDTLEKFTGTHPALMANRIKRADWNFTFDPAVSKKHLYAFV